MDLYGKDRGNISLPSRLQPRNFDDTKLKTSIINTQKAFYNLKIREINRRIERVKQRNKELEDDLEDIDYFMKTLEEEKTQEILDLNTQVIAQTARVDDCKKQLMAIEKLRIDDKIAHTAKIQKINDNYKETRLLLASQIKLSTAKINSLDDYKVMQDVLRKKLQMQDEMLIQEREEVKESLSSIKYKFKIDREKLKEGLYKRLVNLATMFQIEVAPHMPYPIKRLLSENIAINNNLIIITDNMTLQKEDCTTRQKAMKEYKRNLQIAYSNARKATLSTKLGNATIAILREIHSKKDIAKWKKINNTEEQYIVKKDHACFEMRKMEQEKKQLEILLYCEQDKLSIIKHQEQWISDQIQMHIQMLNDIHHMLKTLKSKK